jgi:hypothetical protein
MNPVVLDPELVVKLTSNGGQVPLTDTAGKPVGYFLAPEVFEYMQKVLYDQAFAEMSDDDVRRALANPKRHTMEEVFKLLEGR